MYERYDIISSFHQDLRGFEPSTASGFFPRNQCHDLVHVERFIALVKAYDDGQGEGRHADRNDYARQDQSGGYRVDVSNRVLYAAGDDRRGAALDVTFRGKKQVDSRVGNTQPDYFLDEIPVEKEGREAYAE